MTGGINMTGGMKGIVTACGFPYATISKIPQGMKFFSELKAAITKSPHMDRRLLTVQELNGNIPNQPQGFFEILRADWIETQKRKNMGEEPSFVLYEALQPNQKITFRSCFPGTILPWNTADGNIIATRDSFLFAELTARGENWSTNKVEIKQFSKTQDAFQKFSGHGHVFFEVHGGLEKIPLYPGEVVQVCPGYLIAFSEGIELRMVSAGDKALRNAENEDYWLELSAPANRGGIVFCHTVDETQFWNHR